MTTLTYISCTGVSLSAHRCYPRGYTLIHIQNADKRAREAAHGSGEGEIQVDEGVLGRSGQLKVYK